VSDATKVKLREVGNALDPLQLLEEVRAMQSHLVMLAPACIALWLAP
jgi:hypothetical protein